MNSLIRNAIFVHILIYEYEHCSSLYNSRRVPMSQPLKGQHSLLPTNPTRRTVSLRVKDRCSCFSIETCQTGGEESDRVIRRVHIKSH